MLILIMSYRGVFWLFSSCHKFYPDSMCEYEMQCIRRSRRQKVISSPFYMMGSLSWGKWVHLSWEDSLKENPSLFDCNIREASHSNFIESWINDKLCTKINYSWMKCCLPSTICFWYIDKSWQLSSFYNTTKITSKLLRLFYSIRSKSIVFMSISNHSRNISIRLCMSNKKNIWSHKVSI